MGKIKSALEIALERTENIAIDETKIRAMQKEDKIKRAAGEYLAKEERDGSLLKKLEDYSTDELKGALKSLIISSLSLPSYEINDDRFDRLGAILSIIVEKNSEKCAFFSNVVNFISQYPIHRKQLIEQIEKQLQPALDQKSEEMSRQLGRPIHLTVEDDKETLSIIEDNLERLQNQYNENLDQAKKEIEAWF